MVRVGWIKGLKRHCNTWGSHLANNYLAKIPAIHMLQQSAEHRETQILLSRRELKLESSMSWRTSPFGFIRQRNDCGSCSNVLLILNRSPSVGSHEHHVQLDGGLCLCQGICEGTWDFGYPIWIKNMYATKRRKLNATLPITLCFGYMVI